jgi:putative copper export protein
MLVSSQHLTLTPGLDALRLFLHVTAAAIWVGGQFVMLGLVPTARTLGEEAPKKLARAFARLSWPAFAVLILTGGWNLMALHASTKSTAWSAVMGVKWLLVILAGLGAWLHGRAKTKGGVAAWGSISGTASILALLAGILLAG